jgi:hypothetical protein
MNTQEKAKWEAWLQEPRLLPIGAMRIAEFVDVQLERVTILWRGGAGALYVSLFFPGIQTTSRPLTRVMLEALSYRIQHREVYVLFSAEDVYHCWHVCFCPACAARGGRMWDHAQASFDAHLRFVSNDDLYTFPTAPEAR